MTDERSEQHETDHGHVEAWDLVRIAFVIATIFAAWFHVWEPFPNFSVVGWLGVLVGGYPILKEAIENVLERRMTMELSMILAVIAALAISEVVTGLVILLFVLAAEVLEGMTVGRGRQAIKNLLDLLPHSATVRRDNTLLDVPVEQLRQGDLVIVKPGARLPVDGTVVRGHSVVDQSPITGESVPVEKSVEAVVYAGTINLSGVIEIEASRLGRDTAFGKIVEAVERAESSKAPIQKTADRLAGYLVYFALGCALLTYIVTRNARSTISVVIVAGACGIAAGTPLAILGAIGQAARKGAIIKGGIFLEALSTVDTVVLDKTGTVTLGKLEVIEVCPAPGWPPQILVRSAAIAERLSDHPISGAILRKATAMSCAISEPETVSDHPGKGIRATLCGEEFIVGTRTFLAENHIEIPPVTDGNRASSRVFVSRAGSYLGYLQLADVLRPEAKQAIASLRAQGLKTILLTGDDESVAGEIARDLGVENVEAELLPDQKLQRIRQLTRLGRKVVMVGDGINDAPALAEATVGVAMGSGTDVARESADVVLLGNDLSKFAETVEIARRCRKIIMMNFTGTLAVDTVGVLLAAFGFLNPLLAAFIHVSSELAFILNSARLLPSAAETHEIVK